MSYTLETRVERLERQRPANPYEQMSDEELQARLDLLHKQFKEQLGVALRGLEEAKVLYQASLKGDAEFHVAVERLKTQQAAEGVGRTL